MDTLEEITGGPIAETTTLEPMAPSEEPRRYSGYARRGAKTGLGLTLLLLGTGIAYSPTMREGTLKDLPGAAAGYAVVLAGAVAMGGIGGKFVQDYRNGEE